MLQFLHSIYVVQRWQLRAMMIITRNTKQKQRRKSFNELLLNMVIVSDLPHEKARERECTCVCIQSYSFSERHGQPNHEQWRSLVISYGAFAFANLQNPIAFPSQQKTRGHNSSTRICLSAPSSVLCFCQVQVDKSFFNVFFWDFEWGKNTFYHFGDSQTWLSETSQKMGSSSVRRTKGSPRQKVCTVATPHRQLMVWVYWECEHVVQL